jgi:hypothetical protein
MRNSRMFLKRVAIALSALLLVSAVGLAQVTVSLPTVTYKIGTTQTIPITVGDLTGKGAISFQFTVTYDTSIVSITGVTTTGTLSAGLTAPVVNTTVAGKITVAAAGTSAMSGSGILIYLNTTTKGKGTSALTFSNFQFNEGSPAVTLTNGSVGVPVLSVKVSDLTLTGNAGAAITIPVTSEDVTGKAVLSYQFTVTYDATKINLTGVSITGTMSSAMTAPVVNTSVAGQITVAAAGTSALVGGTTLVNLVGTIVAGGTTTVHFTNFQYNEGTPSAGGVDGIITVVAPAKPVVISFAPNPKPTAVSQNNIVAFNVRAKDPNGGSITYTWKVNGAVVKGPGADSTYSVRFTDPHGVAKSVVCVYATVQGLSDSTVWAFTITGVNDPRVPTDFYLGQNYPNPFNPTTEITYSLPKEAPVTFEIYNLLGVRVRTLMAGQVKNAGQYTITWDGKNDAGVGMPSGVYLYRVSAGSFLASKKMTLLK